MAHQPMPSGVMFSYYQKSEYHDKCVPKKNASEPGRHHSQGDYAKCDQVAIDKSWKRRVEGEKRGVKSWEENWGFLTENDDEDQESEDTGKPSDQFDLQGEPSVFSDELPNTNAGNYGYRATKNIGERIQNMEHKFYADKRRRKMGDDLTCY